MAIALSEWWRNRIGHRGLIDTALGGSLVPPAVSSPEPAPVHLEPIFPGGALDASSAGAEEAALQRTAPDTADGERKLVTLLGCTLAHTPALRDRLGLDGLHSRMRTLYALAQREVQQYGGTLYHVTGDRLLAIFGAPVAQEEHARRAALAACGLRQRLTAYQGVGGDVPDETLRVSMGVHTGLLIIGGMEENPGASLAVVGDLPWLSKRCRRAQRPAPSCAVRRRPVWYAMWCASKPSYLCRCPAGRIRSRPTPSLGRARRASL